MNRFLGYLLGYGLMMVSVVFWSASDWMFLLAFWGGCVVTWAYLKL